jgi:tetratricopeptide (TPR) repeat protein
MERTIRARLLPTLLALACASGVASAQAITTTQDRALAKLEANLAKNPNSFKAVQAVGLKLFDLKRFADSRPVLEKAREMNPRDGTTALYAGLAAEEMKDLVGARAAYTKYLVVGRTKKTKDQIRSRLLAIAHAELKQAAAAAVANEQALRGVQVDGKTVAVLPFSCTCSADMQPLGRGMAELVVTDLARSSALRVLERDRMQAIADEIRLSTAGSVDAQTATRAGKLIQAGTILNGSIVVGGQNNLSLAGALVNTSSGSVTGSPQENGAMSAIFSLEKAFVLKTFGQLNITLTATEMAAFNASRPPTQNINAFLEFSRGLMAQDAGNLDEARRLFENAGSIDPGFGAALQRAQQVQSAQAGAQVSTATVQQSVRNSAEGQVVANAARGSTTDAGTVATLAAVVAGVNPTQTNNVQNNTSSSSNTNTQNNTNTPQTQNTVAQATGGDQPATRVGQVTIVIKRP